MSDSINWPILLDCVKNVPRSNLSNTVEVLHHAPEYGPDRVWYDEFLDRDMTPDREWRDDDDTALTVFCQQDVGMASLPITHAAAAVRHVCRQRTRHCVREYLQSLTWDGEPRIAHTFEDGWGADPSPEQPSDYLRAVSANFFVGLVARVMAPGCQLDTMVVFEGPQGIGKSRALRLIGGDWYALAAESVTTKDFFQALPGKWLVEIGELEAFSRAERERIKTAISTPMDRYRGSYDRRASDHPRQCQFAGTTNRDDYLQDDTGGRRFWPVRCGAIDIPLLTAQRDQWLAEALVAFRAGATWWQTPVSSTLAIQADRQHEDGWTLSVLTWVALRDDVTSAEVLTGALQVREQDIDRTKQNRVAAILRTHGWKRQTVRRPSGPVKGFKKCAED